MPLQVTSLNAASGNQPFWGTPDSNAIWCEAKFTAYAYSPYVAEFWNAMSSLVLVYCGIVCMIAISKTRLQRKTRFYVAAITIIIVGVGSTCFHGMLRRWAQVLDEVPMMLECLAVMYIGIEDTSDEPRYKWLPALMIAVFIAYIYVYISWPIYYFLVSYAVGVFVVTVMYFRFIMEDSSDRFEKVLFSLYLTCYSLGFLVWNLDSIFCDELHSMGLNLHAFGWHVLAAVGVYCFFLMMLVVRIRHLTGKSQSHKMRLQFWPFGFPLLIFDDETKLD